MYCLVFKKRKLRVVTERSWLGLLSRPAAAGLWDAGLSWQHHTHHHSDNLWGEKAHQWFRNPAASQESAHCLSSVPSFYSPPFHLFCLFSTPLFYFFYHPHLVLQQLSEKKWEYTKNLEVLSSLCKGILENLGNYQTKEQRRSKESRMRESRYQKVYYNT